MATVIASTTVRVSGTDRSRTMVVKGQPYDTADPVVKANRWLFVDADEYAAAEARPTNTQQLGRRSMATRKRKVEQATSAPGEKRSVEYSCDDCDFTSTSEQGVKVHAAKSHK